MRIFGEDLSHKKGNNPKNANKAQNGQEATAAKTNGGDVKDDASEAEVEAVIEDPEDEGKVAEDEEPSAETAETVDT